MKALEEPERRSAIPPIVRGLSPRPQGFLTRASISQFLTLQGCLSRLNHLHVVMVLFRVPRSLTCMSAVFFQPSVGLSRGGGLLAMDHLTKPREALVDGL